ncbi:Gfo/Idh/MocA family oxidoreductase [Sinorhizobium sp. 8-89]|uniref:Gfo/Idh/MocA family protein n=1 Tax=Sinorhizobium sp. 7-81 TaxID=3049087 RepID=UPI0024C29CA9|nr:Gfo/Idh/MocA family oxidoreductase [Sinorhizobium sp. 7-81]MDK1390116.1 Gfo/Idh/MocA family oxidoreductase [Sinorhizobium sp. 7-81]
MEKPQSCRYCGVTRRKLLVTANALVKDDRIWVEKSVRSERKGADIMPTRIVQVGLGRWGLDWAETVIPQVPEVEVVGWVEPNPETLERLKSRLGASPNQCFPNLDAALSDVAADAILITANVGAHASLVERALGAGKHVLVEKPFVSTVVEAERLVDLADRSHLILMVSQNFRFFPAAITAARLVREQALGRVGAVHIEFRRFANYTQAEEAYGVYALRQPLLEDLSIHHFDLMRMVLGQEPRQVYCTAWQPTGSSFREPPAAAVTIIFDQGTVVTYRGSWLSDGKETPYGGEWRLECAEGEILWTCRGDRDVSLDGDHVVIRKRGQPAVPIRLPEMPSFGRRESLATFARAVETGTATPYASLGRDNIGSLVLMQAAIASATTGCVIPVEAIRSMPGARLKGR